jgi:hypothetical protein
MAWTENATGVYTNDTGLTLTEEDGQGILTIDELEDEGLDVSIPVQDLLDNPFVKVPVLDENGKLSPDAIPSIVIGDTFYANSESEMLQLSAAQKGDVCIRLDIAGGASYRLMGNNYSVLSNWAELRARYIFWSDVREKPLKFTPEEHDHDDLYPRIGTNGKISASVLPFINFFGSRYVRNSQSAMLALSATPGDVCIRTDENKLYLCMGLPNVLSSWVYLPSPSSANVESIIMQGEDHIGYVEITPEAIGAALEEHTHEYPDTIIEIGEDSELQIKFIRNKEEFQLYINGDHIASIGNFILEQGGQKIKIVREVIGGIPTLLWLDPLNGDTPTPFA